VDHPREQSARKRGGGTLITLDEQLQVKGHSEAGVIEIHQAVLCPT
jgi:hypothetical protein